MIIDIKLNKIINKFHTIHSISLFINIQRNYPDKTSLNDLHIVPANYQRYKEFHLVEVLSHSRIKIKFLNPVSAAER